MAYSSESLALRGDGQKTRRLRYSGYWLTECESRFTESRRRRTEDHDWERILARPVRPLYAGIGIGIRNASGRSPAGSTMDHDDDEVAMLPGKIK
jgi:hypothetical protein